MSCCNRCHHRIVELEKKVEVMSKSLGFVWKERMVDISTKVGCENEPR